MSAQTDLFAPTAPVLRRCGVCVHLNRAPGELQGYCTPRGWRLPLDEPCAMGFPRTQLGLDAKGRPLAGGEAA